MRLPEVANPRDSPKHMNPMLQNMLVFSASVCWRFLGDSAFHKKLGPQQIPVSVDSEDPIIV